MYVGIGVSRYIYTHSFKRGCIKAYSLDKVILKLRNGQVVTGIVHYIGTKNLSLVINKPIQGRVKLHYPIFECKIRDIDGFTVYPKDSQRYGVINV